MNNQSADTSSCFWQPFTQMKTAAPPLRVRSGNGIMLELEDGRRLMDCISSWWVTLHGHCQPEIVEAICCQAGKLEQVICAGMTHEPAEMLARRIVDLLPGNLAGVFYSDDGSTAVEVALKMAFQYWKNKGRTDRTRFLAFEGAYHGDTLGAMSVGHRSMFTSAFKELLFDVDFIPFPATFIGDDEVAAKEDAALACLDRVLSAAGDQYAAFIIEPLVQGAGGMRMCRPEFLRQVEKRLRDYGILEIYDEVMTGFGRTGEYFACIKTKTTPDIVCLSKGITGGFLPLAATVCTDDVFYAFYDDDPGKTFYHGHSYTANPMGCAAGVASLDLLEANREPFKKIEAWHQKGIKKIEGHRLLTRFRICGTIAAMDIDVPDAGYLSRTGPKLKAGFIERGFLLRPLGNVLYILPPYCITQDQIHSIYKTIAEVVETL
ncbi:MAG: adenosylmethionine--8-amino-7-oxononanoate transaminase [Deltaproteobacteria bacterium]|nr:adenosylmethionine--8-amino-7-oxononanoate transaminase [Deltaproteobacteria bacterium]